VTCSSILLDALSGFFAIAETSPKATFAFPGPTRAIPTVAPVTRIPQSPIRADDAACGANICTHGFAFTFQRVTTAVTGFHWFQ
jgi:hypothetical protein